MLGSGAPTSAPKVLEAAVTAALDLLEKQLQATLTTASTHRVLIVSGWSASKATIEAIATYLVGLVMDSITSVLKVRANFLDTTDDRAEILRNVERLSGTTSAPLTADKKQDERNPWIAEGIWHLCLLLSSRRPEFHAPGRVIALDQPHVRAKDHGFDVLAIYRSGSSFGVSFVESKAYEKDPNGAINKSVEFFKEVDNKQHDERARKAMSAMRGLLTQQEQDQVSVSLWKEARAYVPNPHYDAQYSPKWHHARSSFKDLHVPAERIVIMPHEIQGFSAFFDQIASEMLRIANTIAHV
jgi:hypothetical protein